jgi:hypothetical protein
MKIAAARPTPMSLRSGLSANAPKTEIMIRAAAVMTFALIGAEDDGTDRSACSSPGLVVFSYHASCH